MSILNNEGASLVFCGSLGPVVVEAALALAAAVVVVVDREVGLYLVVEHPLEEDADDEVTKDG